MESQIADLAFYRRVKDMRGYLYETGSGEQNWRLRLRRELFVDRVGKSDLTQATLFDSFEMHEGLFERKWIGKQHWQGLLFAGANSFLLRVAEHRPDPPDRTLCYWLSVIRYGRADVDLWVKSLPFKVAPSLPWQQSCGLDIISQIPQQYEVGKKWFDWFDKHKRLLDTEA